MNEFTPIISPYRKITSPYGVRQTLDTFLMIDSRNFLLIDETDKLKIGGESGPIYSRLSAYANMTSPYSKR
jgi:hypothetical protein